MTPRSELLLLTSLVVATRVGDGLTTYLATRDLQRELNPLAAGGWPVLILVAGVMVVIATFLNYRQLFHPIENFPAVAGADFRQFKRHYFDPHSNPLAGSRPGALFVHVFGYVLSRTLIAWSLLLIVNNLLTYADVQPYVEIKRQYKLWIAFYLALPLIGMYFVDRLIRNDFRRYRARGAFTGRTRSSS